MTSLDCPVFFGGKSLSRQVFLAKLLADDVITVRLTMDTRLKSETRDLGEASVSIRARWVWGTLAVVVAGVYVAFHLQTGWFPHDEGQLGQAAERVMQGELPHRDFDEMYTGALTYLNAASFHLFGVRSESTRWMLFLFFLPFCASLFWIAARACPPWAAALVTFFCAAISLPVYSAAIPSWYNLFFMTFGIAAMLRFLDTGHIRWILLAGGFAGVSMLFKITGLYWLAAAILFLVYHEQQLPAQSNKSSLTFNLLVSICLGLFALIGLGFCRTVDPLMAGIHLSLPMISIAAFLSWQQCRYANKGSFRFRLQRLLKLQIPLITAALVPLAGLIVFYWVHGATSSLYEGLVELPRRRLEGASSPFPATIWFCCAVPLAAIVLAALLSSCKWTSALSLSGACKKWIVVLGCVAGLVIILTWKTPWGFQLTFQSVRNIGPFICLGGLATLALRHKKLPTRHKAELFLLVAAATLASLVQFPFAADFYFMYAAPVVVLGAVFLTRWQPVQMRAVQAFVLGGITLFAITRMASPVPNANINGKSDGIAESVGLERCSLVVRAPTAQVYREVITEIQARTAPGDYIFAGPDFPEAYFFANRRNPTRIFYDFFQPEFSADTASLLQLLNEHEVNLVVLKQFQVFSPQSAELQAMIADQFPHQKRINRYHRNASTATGAAFIVYWRIPRQNQQNSPERH